MERKESLSQIREKERKSHIALYSESELYKEGSWLKKPIQTVTEILPHFQERTNLRVLDLGCGVGRNCIGIAQHFQNISCSIDCVDILKFAIEKLEYNAREYGVSHCIHGIIKPIEDFPVPAQYYDWILAVSALEHIDCKASFVRKLAQIRDGIRQDGIVCLVINSNVREFDKATHSAAFPQFEVNLQTEELTALLKDAFSGWTVIKNTVREQHYDIPRESGIHDLQTTVVTFVARNG